MSENEQILILAVCYQSAASLNRCEFCTELFECVFLVVAGYVQFVEIWCVLEKHRNVAK